MDKRYQIFVSSTFEDLKDERKKIIEAILNFNHIPAGMEMFTASNDEQFEYIKKILKTCDYYVLIVGGRYGSVNPVTGISYTEQEYNYALELGLPILAFVHETPFDLPQIRRDDHNRELFSAFLARIKTGRMVKYWSNIDNLISSVLLGLTYEISNSPGLGWVRGGEETNSELLKQLNDLRLEKEEIQKKYEDIKVKEQNTEILIDNLAGMDELYTIYFRNYDDQKYQKECTWHNIFSLVGSYLYSALSYDQFCTSLESAFEIYCINQNSAQTIKTQLLAQGLIDLFTEKDSDGTNQEQIILSDKGKKYLLENKTIKTNKIK